jgi:hypothetical protein
MSGAFKSQASETQISPRYLATLSIEGLFGNKYFSIFTAGKSFLLGDMSYKPSSGQGFMGLHNKIRPRSVGLIWSAKTFEKAPQK